MRRTRQRRQSSSHVLKREDHRVTERGQAAMEFLMSYGWALLVTLVVVGALAYLGILEPARFVPNKCNLGPGFSCEFFKVDLSGDGYPLSITYDKREHIIIGMKHSLGKSLTNVKLAVRDMTVAGESKYPGGTPLCSSSLSSDAFDEAESLLMVWPDGTIALFLICREHPLTMPDPWAVGKKMRAQLTLDYIQNGISRTRTGEIVADVEE
jgi:hypothetical protein